QGADAAERGELAAAGSALDEVERTQAALERARTVAAEAARAERTARAGARRAGYAEAASWGTASAAFHAALALAAADAGRRAALEHAAQRLDAFSRDFAASEQSEEALYRLGEVHLQLAARAYQEDLAAFLARGGKADAAPLPVESYTDAIDAYRRLLRAYPDTPRAHDARYSLGFVLAETGAAEASAEVLDRFLHDADSLDARRGPAALRLGDDRLQSQDREAALTAFRIAARSSDAESSDLG